MTARRFLAGYGVLLLAAGLWASLSSLWQPISSYDEGILLSHSRFILRGAVAHRDYYANYPPGLCLVVAGLWTATGVSAFAMRLVLLAVRLLTVAAAGVLGGRLQGRSFSLLSAGLTAFWSGRIDLNPSAWGLGLLAALVFIGLAARCRSGRWGDVWPAGLVLGFLACSRHDLTLYWAAALAVGLALPRGWRLPLGWPRPSAAAVGRLLASSLLVLLPVWGPVLAFAGPSRVVHDLVLDQARRVQPHRLVPLPPLLAWTPPAGLDVPLPAFLVSPHAGAAVLVLAGPLVAAFVCWRLRREGRPEAGLLGALTLAVLPYALQRSDLGHVVQTLPPVLILAAVVIERVAASRLWLGIAAGVALALPILASGGLSLPTLPPPPPDPRLVLGLEHASGLPEVTPRVARARRWLLRYLERWTAPDEPIYFGLPSHAHIHVNEVDLYFLADRLPATRYAQFDPGLLADDDVQREMVEQLERADVQTIVISHRFWRGVPAPPPETRLDRYIASQFVEVRRFDFYAVLRKRTIAHVSTGRARAQSTIVSFE